MHEATIILYCVIFLTSKERIKASASPPAGETRARELTCWFSYPFFFCLQTRNVAEDSSHRRVRQTNPNRKSLYIWERKKIIQSTFEPEIRLFDSKKKKEKNENITITPSNKIGIPFSFVVSPTIEF